MNTYTFQESLIWEGGTPKVDTFTGKRVQVRAHSEVEATHKVNRKYRTRGLGRTWILVATKYGR